MNAQTLLNFLEKAGVVIVLASDGDAIVSNKSSRQLTAKELELFINLKEEIIAVLKSRKISSNAGKSPELIWYC
jgi:hypothetical protein